MSHNEGFGRRHKDDVITLWVGFDLDGTLAHYDSFVDLTHIGEPIEPMVLKVQEYLQMLIPVKIFTARVSINNPTERLYIIQAIEDWCQKHIGTVLPITCIKDLGCIRIYDDRAVQVEKNTGRIIGGDTQ